MLEWFVRTGTQQLGPLSEQSLRAMAERGELDADATIWRPGMSEWIASSELLSRAETPSAGSVPESSSLGAMLGTNLGVSPWARLWARNLDLLLWTSVASLLIGAVAPSLFLEDGLFAARWGSRLLAWLLAPGVLVLDAFIYTLFGTTPGKAFAGLKVRDTRGARLAFWPYLKRNFQMFWYGLGLGVPIVSFATLYSSFQKASHGEILAWDRAAGTQVRSTASGSFRTTCAAIIYLSIVGASSLYERYDTISDAAKRAMGEPGESGDSAGKPTHGPAANAAARLRATAEAVRKAAPALIDAQTRLDGATDGPGLNFTYNYTLVDVSDSDVDTPKLHDAMYDSLKPRVCTGAEFKGFRDLECTVHFRYSDKRGLHITTISVTPYDCGAVK